MPSFPMAESPFVLAPAPETLRASRPEASAGHALNRHTGVNSGLVHAWQGYLSERLWYYYHTAHKAPTFISRKVLDTAGFVGHFPHHTILDLSGLKSCVASLSPAACLHAFSSFRGARLDDDGSGVMVTGPCAQHEASGDTVHLSRFQMMELVAIGTPGYVAATRKLIAEEIALAFEELGIRGSFLDVEDTSPLMRCAHSVQNKKGLEYEFLTLSGSGPLPIAAISDHRDVLGRRFDIEDVNGAPAHSICVAFDIDRLVESGIATWGASTDGWPEALVSRVPSIASELR